MLELINSVKLKDTELIPPPQKKSVVFLTTICFIVIPSKVKTFNLGGKLRQEKGGETVGYFKTKCLWEGKTTEFSKGGEIPHPEGKLIETGSKQLNSFKKFLKPVRLARPLPPQDYINSKDS